MSMTDNILKNSRLFVFIGFIAPIAYIIMKLEGTMWFWVTIGAAGFGAWQFNENFIDKSLVRPAKEMRVGPQEDFAPPESNMWNQTQDEHGNYVPKKQFSPPPLKINRPPRYG